MNPILRLLLIAIFAISAQASGQKVPKWLHTPPKPATGGAIGIGISDLGMDKNAAVRQAEQRALFMARVAFSPRLQFSDISTMINPETGVAEMEPRTSFSIELELPGGLASGVKKIDQYESAGVVFVLMQASFNKDENGSSEVRFSRDVEGNMSQTLITATSWQDSVLISATVKDGVLEYEGSWPETKERVRIETGSNASSKMPAWLKEKGKRKTDAAKHVTTDIALLQGRAAPFLSFLQAYLSALGNLSRKGGYDVIEFEDPLTVGNATVFSSTQKKGSALMEAPVITNLLFSRTGSRYQCILRMESGTPAER